MIEGIFGGLASNLLSGVLNSTMQYHNQSALMQQQFRNQIQLNKFNAKLNDRYQRNLLYDSATLQKSSLQSAGLSVGSMLNSYTPLGSNVNASGSASGGSAVSPGINLDFVNAILGMSQAKLNDSAASKNEAEANKIEKEAAWIDDINDANVSKTIADTYKARQELRNLRQDLSESISRMKLNDEERKQVSANIDKVINETNSIRINNKYLDDLNNATISEKLANIQKALADSNYTVVRTDLAKLGIGVSSNWIESLVALSHYGNVGTAFKDIKFGLTDAIKELVSNNSNKSVAGAVGAAGDCLGTLLGQLFNLLFNK